MKTYIIYHDNCSDGFCAAWVARKAYPDAEFLPYWYGKKIPSNLEGSRVFVLDFSFPRQDIEVLLSKTDLTLLDHHKTALENLSGLDPSRIILDMNKSGGRLTWDYFFPGKPAPWLVDYTEDRDLWKFTLQESRAVSAGIKSYPYDFVLWDSWTAGDNYDLGWKMLAQEGRPILRYQDEIIKTAVANAVEFELADYKILAVNSTVLVSEIAGELAKGRPFGAVYFVRADSKTQWSLRSDENGVDVSEIAKAYGGGGHKHAAGFELEQKMGEEPGEEPTQ